MEVLKLGTIVTTGRQAIAGGGALHEGRRGDNGSSGDALDLLGGRGRARPVPLRSCAAWGIADTEAPVPSHQERVAQREHGLAGCWALGLSKSQVAPREPATSRNAQDCGLMRDPSTHE